MSRIKYLLGGLLLAASIAVLGAAAPAVQNTLLNLCPGVNTCLGAPGVIEFWTDGSKRAAFDVDGNLTLDDNLTVTGNSLLTGTVTQSGQLTVSPILLGAAGVRMTGDGDGAITFLGAGGGSDEDLTLNFDDTANTVSFSTSTGVTTLDFAAMDFTTTGTFLNPREVEANAVTATPAAAESGKVFTNTGDADGSAVTLPNDPVIGLEFTIIATAAQTITITASAGETIEADGATCGTSVTLADGESVIIISATAGSGAQWHVVGGQGFTCNA